MVFKSQTHKTVKRAVSQQKCRQFKLIKQFKKIKEEMRTKHNCDDDDDYIQKNHLFNSMIVDDKNSSLNVMETPIVD